MQILERRHKLRRVAWDDKTIQELQEEIRRLERMLRELDE
jgi:hypothetical protein